MAEVKADEIGKKCAFSGKILKKAKRYYRNGLYYVNRAAFKGKMKKDEEEGAKDKAAAETKAAEDKAVAAKAEAKAVETKAAETKTTEAKE